MFSLMGRAQACSSRSAFLVSESFSASTFSCSCRPISSRFSASRFSASATSFPAVSSSFRAAVSASSRFRPSPTLSCRSSLFRPGRSSCTLSAAAFFFFSASSRSCTRSARVFHQASPLSSASISRVHFSRSCRRPSLSAVARARSSSPSIICRWPPIWSSMASFSRTASSYPWTMTSAIRP